MIHVASFLSFVHRLVLHFTSLHRSFSSLMHGEAVEGLFGWMFLS